MGSSVIVEHYGNFYFFSKYCLFFVILFGLYLSTSSELDFLGDSDNYLQLAKSGLFFNFLWIFSGLLSLIIEVCTSSRSPTSFISLVDESEFVVASSKPGGSGPQSTDLKVCSFSYTFFSFS